MQAYHNDQKIKDKYVQRMRDHIAADELIRGEGFNDKGKGCAVGCTLNRYDHKGFELELGIPEWLARVEDVLFEGMNLKKSKTFPLIFLESINVGADLEQIKAAFIIYVLESLFAHFDNEAYPEVTKAIKEVINLYKTKGTPDGGSDWTAAEAAARTPAWTPAWTAARIVAEAARSAARVAAWAAGSAAWAAEAVMSAARVAEAARSAAWTAKATARATTTAYDKFADKLLELIKECK